MDEPFLSASDFSRLAETGIVDPRRIRFSQNSISPIFKGAYGSVAGLAERLSSGQVSPLEIKPIRIVVRTGQVYTLDNRRLKAFQEAGLEIPYLKLDEIPAAEEFKFTTENEGLSVLVRDA